MYTIKELADLAGVTTRTLRYYDQVGILNPASLGSNGYRYYDLDSLLRLQQILFFRELDVPLKEIQYILSRPDFHLLPALKNHQEAIRNKVKRYQELLGTVEKTISNLNGDKIMAENEYFEGFDESQYEEEAKERWGHTSQSRESQRKWSSYSADQKEEIKREGNQIVVRIVTGNPETRPDDPEVQKAVEDYFDYFNRYFYTLDVEFFRSLADMWVEDPRFAVNYERIREGGAVFVREAVNIYCDNQSEEE